MNYLDKINASADYLRTRTKYKPAIGMILGSGLGSMADQIENPDKFPAMPPQAKTKVKA